MIPNSEHHFGSLWTKLFELLASGAMESVQIGQSRHVPRDAVDISWPGCVPSRAVPASRSKTAQVRLRQADPRPTLVIYAQAATDADRVAADLLADLLDPLGGGSTG